MALSVDPLLLELTKLTDFRDEKVNSILYNLVL